MKKNTLFQALLIALLPVPSAFAQAPEACSAFALSSPPKWLTSAVWSPTSKQILAVDASEGVLRVFGPDGREGRADSESDLLGAPSKRPVRITPTDSGYLVKLTGRQTISLSRSLVASPAFGLDAVPAGQRTIGAAYEWTVSGTTVFGVGSVRSGGKQLSTTGPTDPTFELGFFSAVLDGNVREPRIIKSVNNIDYYLLGLDTMGVAADGRVFFLAMDPASRTGTSEPTATVEVFDPRTGTVSTVARMPADYQRLEPLKTQVTGPKLVADLYGEVQHKRMASGLYVAGNTVYLLTRTEDTTRQGTLWLMHKLDTGTGVYTGVVRLPTTAPHITVVRAEDSWFVFERDIVLGWGLQNVPNLLSIPSSWIEDPATSGLKYPGSRVEACVKR
jgi:hypothetical protein